MTLEDRSWTKIVTAALVDARHEVISMFFREETAASQGRFKVLRTTPDQVIVAIPKNEIDQLMTTRVNLNRH